MYEWTDGCWLGIYFFVHIHLQLETLSRYYHVICKNNTHLRKLLIHTKTKLNEYQQKVKT